VSPEDVRRFLPNVHRILLLTYDLPRIASDRKISKHKGLAQMRDIARQVENLAGGIAKAA
jgi:hypothetical protein